MIPYLRFEILSDTYLPSPYMNMGLSPTPPPAPKPEANMDWDGECQVIHELSDVKCCFCYLNVWIQTYEMIHIFLSVNCHRKFHVFRKRDSR